MKIKDLPDGKIKLNDGKDYPYKIDKKQKHIARNTGKHIVVNQEFLNETDEHKKTIYYHEKGHSFWFNKIVHYFSVFLIILLLGFLTYLFSAFIKKDLDLAIISGISLFSSFIAYVLSRYLIEIICDFNAVKNMGVKNFNGAIIYYYKTHNKVDLVNHPYWKWRQRIIGDLN